MQIKPYRFEKKILSAIILVATLPLIASLIMGQGILREAFGVGVNPQIRDELERSLTIQRIQLRSLRRATELAADAIANDAKLQRSLSQQGIGQEKEIRRLAHQYPFLQRIGKSVGNKTVEIFKKANRLSSHKSSKKNRLRTIERSINPERALNPIVLKLTFSIDSAPFIEYQKSGQVVRVYQRLESRAAWISARYFIAYIGLLILITGLTIWLGIVLSRRVTRRVAVLAEATHRVGQGDLSVQVQTQSQDEIGDLIHAFNKMVRDLKQSRERIDYLGKISAWQGFARRLAHEIKNPLTPIKLAIQELKRIDQQLISSAKNTESGKDKVQLTADIVLEEVSTLHRLVDEFSSFAKLPEVKTSKVDLVELIQETRRNWELDTSPSIRIRWNLPSEPLLAEVDTMMLKRCIDNLIRNAQEACIRAQQPNPCLEITAMTVQINDEKTALQPAEHRLVFEDNGPGIREEDHIRVFEPYFTTHPAGTGLGLAIVKKIILDHAGSIRCGRGETKGAKFTIQLPAV